MRYVEEHHLMGHIRNALREWPTRKTKHPAEASVDERKREEIIGRIRDQIFGRYRRVIEPDQDPHCSRPVGWSEKDPDPIQLCSNRVPLPPQRRVGADDDARPNTPGKLP